MLALVPRQMTKNDDFGFPVDFRCEIACEATFLSMGWLFLRLLLRCEITIKAQAFSKNPVKNFC
jgi:hypothetical protein